MSIINSKIPILGKDHTTYASIVNNESKYYCLCIEQPDTIYIYDESFHFLTKQKLNRICDNMTFCKHKKIFYFNSKVTNDVNKIIITDINLKVIKEIKYRINEEVINSLYYSEEEESLYIITNNYVGILNENGKIKIILSRFQMNKNKNSLNSIFKFNTVIILQQELCISYCKENKNYLTKIKNGEITEEYFIDSDSQIQNLINKNNHLQLLINQKYNYLCETNIYLDNAMNEKKIKEKSNRIEKNKYNDCNEEIYCNCCVYSEMESIVQEQKRNC